MDTRSLKREYRSKKEEIEERLKDFGRVIAGGDEDIFAELAYCICTAQAKAVEADRAIRQLKDTGLLYSGSAEDIKPYLRRVRFWNKKAFYIVAARRSLTRNGRILLKEALNGPDPLSMRESFVSRILGIGYKEASHFLRNIGLGGELTILDRYILRCLKSLGVIREIPVSMTKKRYLAIEKKMRRFSKRIKIPLDHLDLLLWSSQTGKIFK